MFATGGIFLLDQQGAAYYQACFTNNLYGFGLSGILPGGEWSVTCVSEVGEGRSDSCPPICRGKRVDLSRGVKVEQAVSKDARRLH